MGHTGNCITIQVHYYVLNPLNPFRAAFLAFARHEALFFHHIMHVMGRTFTKPFGLLKIALQNFGLLDLPDVPTESAHVTSSLLMIRNTTRFALQVKRPSYVQLYCVSVSAIPNV